MTKYKKLLLGLGITISSTHLAEARENTITEEDQFARRSPSPIFLEVEGLKNIPQDDFNVGCSVTNSGC